MIYVTHSRVLGPPPAWAYQSSESFSGTGKRLPLHDMPTSPTIPFGWQPIRSAGV